MTGPLKKPGGRIAWGITGAGHFLRECIEIIRNQGELDIFLSRAAEEVLASYHLLETLDALGSGVFRESSSSAYPVTKLYTGFYSAVVIAPVTSNSIAKMTVGISDGLVTNLFAHAGKCRVPIFLLPCDWAPAIDSSTPTGDVVQLYPRPIDLANIDCLATWPGVRVLRGVSELLDRLRFLNSP